MNDEVLAKAFYKYPSMQKARVIRDKRTSKTRGFGFVSFKDAHDFARALREMNGNCYTLFFFPFLVFNLQLVQLIH